MIERPIASGLGHWARSIKRDTHAVYLAARDPRTPWYAKALALLIAAYALSPIDLIPDFIPVLGYLDELILLPLGLMLVVRMVPYFGALIPMYLLFRQVGLTNSLVGLTLSHLVITVPLTTWIMIGFIEDVPRELEEAGVVLEGVRLVEAFDRKIVLAVVHGVGGRQSQLLVGTAEVKDSPEQAAVLAVLDATNRWYLQQR